MSDHLAPFRKYAVGLQEDLDTVDGDTLMVSKGELRTLLNIAKNVERICRHAEGDFVLKSTKLLNALATAGIQDILDKRAELEAERTRLRARIRELEDQDEDIEGDDWDELNDAYIRVAQIKVELEALDAKKATATSP